MKAKWAGGSEGFSMLVLRAWMWLVPAGIFVVAAVFATLAAINERWGLLAVMVLMGLLAIALFVLHWWLMYGLGSRSR